MATARAHVAGVKLPQPRSAEAVELSRLVDERLALDARIDAIEEAQRTAWETLRRLSAELAELERRAAGGDKVTDSERTKLEQKLAAARARAQEPWAERRGGLELAARDADPCDWAVRRREPRRAVVARSS
jgi:hypothetical protein